MLKKLKGAGTKVLSKAKTRASAPGDPYILALDIGTENVKAIIGHVRPAGDIEIVGVGRAHQNLTDMAAGAIADIAAVTANCDKALSDAEAQAGLSASSVVIGIAGELVKGTTTTIRITRKDAQKPLDVAEVEQMVSLVQDRAEKRAKDQLAIELGGKDVEVRLVNSALVRITIDGYPITNPVGFQGREVVVQLYTAFAPLIHIGALERVANELDLDLIAVAAEPFAVARAVVGDDPNANTSAILMDVGGGTTDIAVVHEGGVQGTKMFGIGGRAFTKSIERDLGLEFLQAEALKVGLSSGRIPAEKSKQIENPLRKTLEVWRGGVELALDEFNVEQMPHRVLLCGGGSSLDMLFDELDKSSWYKELPFTRPPEVQLIQPEDIDGFVDKTNSLTDHTFITAMGLLRVAVDTTEQTGQAISAGSLKEKFNKLLKV
ncbi:MAG: ethanolamine ammonia-lyase reactivating factor EutA [bacterium]|nr:ethanolamine ammonia-lyase reactivating factor EutA [bacterium]